MTDTIRVVGWEVRPVVMLDDGENLSPLGVKPVMVYAKDWDTFKASGDQKTIDYIRSQIPPTQSSED